MHNECLHLFGGVLQSCDASFKVFAMVLELFFVLTGNDELFDKQVLIAFQGLEFAFQTVVTELNDGLLG